MSISQPTFFLGEEIDYTEKWIQLHHIICDRGSLYSVTAGRIESRADVKEFVKRVKKDKKYSKATHNTYAGRFKDGNRVVDVKNDDGETAAGMVILRQLHHANIVNIIVVVTRWYGGVKLYGDRFKHVQDATKRILESTVI